MTELSPFSQQIAAEVERDFPQWAGLGRVDRWKEAPVHWELEVKAPVEADALPLRISTYDEEITVSFDEYHTHFDRWTPQAGDTRHQSAKLFVDAVLREDIAALTWLSGELVRMTSQLERGQAIEPGIPIPGIDAVRARSWHGKLNIDESLKALRTRKAVLGAPPPPANKTSSSSPPACSPRTVTPAPR